MEAHEEAWSPEKRAFAGQWLVEQRLERLRKAMPELAFIELARAVDLLLSAWEAAADRGREAQD